MGHYAATLASLRQQDRLRSLRKIDSETAPRVTINGREILLFCANNYLGLTQNPQLKAAACRAIADYGVGSGASRLISGNHLLFESLESRLAQLKGSESALVFNSGYTANLGVLPALATKDTLILADRLNHASLFEACRASEGRLKIYRHKDMAQLAALLKKQPPGRQLLIVTDGIFSMDGDIAPLPELLALAEQYDTTIYLDDAHATGVLGSKGGGTAEHFGITSTRIIHMGTLSKALGGFGGFVAGPCELIDFLINTSKAFIYTTALPPSVIATAIAALDLCQTQPALRLKLWENTNFLRTALNNLGFDTGESETPIIPILLGESRLAQNFAALLFDRGVYVAAIRPPTVPEGSARLRLTLMANHSKADIETLLEQMKTIGQSLGVI